jgi:uncharacterized membrane protein
MRRYTWILLAFFALPFALYAFAYVVVGRPMYPPPLAASFLSRPWGINPHALFGGTGLLLGALQFSSQLRRRSIRVHRLFGRVYVIACLVTGTAGMYMAAYSYGGWITHTGFALLGALLVLTTTLAFLTIRKGDVESHKSWMVRSYALMFAAVALRLELPLLGLAYDFQTSYRIVSWLCWVPNLVVAQWIVTAMRARSTAPEIQRADMRAALPSR